MENIKHFEVLNNINVNDKVEKKDKLTYLSWAWAWSEIKKKYPDAKYGIEKNENKMPYFYDDLTGYVVYTWVEIETIRHEMWLPVMDSKNKTMFKNPYKYKTKYGEKTVEKATMFDINKSLMRCLTKNLAMFGLGLYIYNGEDLPEVENKDKKKEDKKPEVKPEEPKKEKTLDSKDIEELEKLATSNIAKYNHTELIDFVLIKLKEKNQTSTNLNSIPKKYLSVIKNMITMYKTKKEQATLKAKENNSQKNKKTDKNNPPDFKDRPKTKDF